jgi:tetratricopeptide (TPR) repeat protein
MKYDRFDIIIFVFFAGSIIALAASSLRALPGKTTAVESRSMERELAAQARLSLLDRLYAPVDAAVRAGQYQEALLKLEEVAVRYPGEAHGYILKGEILDRLEYYDRAAEAFAKGIKLNGDYIDKRSSLTKRETIARMVEKTLPGAITAYRANPGNLSMKTNLANLNYLKSRLAGGCE